MGSELFLGLEIASSGPLEQPWMEAYAVAGRSFGSGHLLLIGGC